ncbi:serine/threonine-protein kinase [Nocardia nova]|uniref:serine/threonine-protein kinase n=1 Tax=Nocardia nova TaxID=37330 RepID=UPI0033CD853B
MEVPRSLAGTRFGPYEVRSLLGRGGMGEVYEAFDTGRDRVVALKVLPEQLAMDPTYADRFRRESQAVSGLAEPHILPVHDSGEIGGVLFVDMRLVRGESLRTLLRRQGKLAPDRAVAIIEQVAAALDAAHTAGLTHRDVKPANVLVTPSDFAYLTDFGIARSDGESAVTTAGHAAGTYTYMAPERFDSGPITARADIYSLACVLYECLTGSTPFSAQSVSVLIRSHLSEPPPRPSAERGDVPAAMDAVIARAMAKAPADRYQTAGQFTAAARAALAAGAEPDTTADPPTTIFGAELLADPPPAATSPRPAGPVAGEVAAAGASDYRREPEPTTFQPFGPEGPTIAANFQPRGRGDTEAPSPDAPAETTPKVLNSTAAQPVPGTPQPRADRGEAPPATSPAYETTGTLRIIAPPDKDELDTTGDLPIIHPSDPTSVKPGEFHFAPFQEGAAPHTPGRPQAPTPSRPAAEPVHANGVGGYDEPAGDAIGDPEPVTDPRTELLDPAQLRADARSGSRDGYGAGGPATGARAAAPSGGDTQFLDISGPGTGGDTRFLPMPERGTGERGDTRFQDVPGRGPDASRDTRFQDAPGTGGDTQFLALPERGTGKGGDTQFLDLAGLNGERSFDDRDGREDDSRYDDSEYDSGYAYDSDYDTGYDETGYDDDHGDAAYGAYRDDYDDSDEGVIRRYEDDLRYAEPAAHADDADDGFAFGAADHDDPAPAKRSRSVAVPVVLGVLGAAVLAGIGVVGWQVFGSSSSSDRPATAAAQVAPVTATPRQAAVPTAGPTSTATPTTTNSASGLPVGAKQCSANSGSDSSFGKAATGTAVTTCGFAEAVREAYATSAQSHGATSAASADASTSIIAVSPATGQSYPMNCTNSGKYVTCTGGDNAVVYVY